SHRLFRHARARPVVSPSRPGPPHRPHLRRRRNPRRRRPPRRPPPLPQLRLVPRPPRPLLPPLRQATGRSALRRQPTPDGTTLIRISTVVLIQRDRPPCDGPFAKRQQFPKLPISQLPL